VKRLLKQLSGCKFLLPQRKKKAELSQRISLLLLTAHNCRNNYEDIIQTETVPNFQQLLMKVIFAHRALL
jgi:hypothetical protein